MSKREHYVFAYDIGNSRRQYQIRKILKAYTVGHQKSLYECWCQFHSKTEPQLWSKIEPPYERCFIR